MFLLVNAYRCIIFASIPVVIMADLMAAGLQSGWSVLRRPTTPATWGQDIEVPCCILKGTRRLSDGWFDGLAASELAANMLTPGAIMSGWNRKHWLPFYLCYKYN